MTDSFWTCRLVPTSNFPNNGILWASLCLGRLPRSRISRSKGVYSQSCLFTFASLFPRIYLCHVNIEWSQFSLNQGVTRVIRLPELNVIWLWALWLAVSCTNRGDGVPCFTLRNSDSSRGIAVSPGTWHEVNWQSVWGGVIEAPRVSCSWEVYKGCEKSCCTKRN